MSKKNKKNCSTREFTALKTSNCQDKKQDNKPNDKSRPEQMRFTDRDPKPSFEV